MQWHIRTLEPLNPRELLPIESYSLVSIRRHDIPQRHVDVTTGETNGRRTRDHERFGDVMPGNKPKFLKELSHHGFSRMFPLFHVPSRRQPKLRIPMIDEKNMIPIHNREVRDQVFCGNGGFRSTKERRS